MKILILGASGQLGKSLVEELSHTNFEIISSSRSDIDITDFIHTKDKIISSNADVVINAIAYTAVDNAELEIDKTNLVNNVAVSNIAEICCEMNSVLIHFSTDYVFDGTSTKPYIESEKVNPLSVYGDTKLMGEYAIKKSGCSHLIFRAGWIYSEYGNNFLKTMLHLGKHKKEINIVGDQIGSPTYAKDISNIVIKALYLIKKDNCEYGIYHYGGNESCSWYEFAKYIFDEAKNHNFKIPNINEIPSSSYLTQAKRPKYSVLNSNKAMKKFGILPSDLKRGIRATLENLNINSSQSS